MRPLLAECAGTFVLVLGGCTVLAAEHVGYAGAALASRLSLPAMIYTVGPLSAATSTLRRCPACC